MVVFPFSSAGLSAVPEAPALIAERSLRQLRHLVVAVAATVRSARPSPSAMAAARSAAWSRANRVTLTLYGCRNSRSPVAA